MIRLTTLLVKYCHKFHSILVQRSSDNVPADLLIRYVSIVIVEIYYIKLKDL